MRRRFLSIFVALLLQTANGLAGRKAGAHWRKHAALGMPMPSALSPGDLQWALGTDDEAKADGEQDVRPTKSSRPPPPQPRVSPALKRRHAGPLLWAGEDAFAANKLFSRANLPRGIPPWAFFAALGLLLLGNFGVVLLVVAERLAPGSVPPINALTDIANAAMEAAVSDGEVPKPMATMYGQQVWLNLLGEYLSSGQNAPEFVARWCESDSSHVDLCLAAKAEAVARGAASAR